jgi:BlaI family transcriptional regulator, penicillinase repressor
MSKEKQNGMPTLSRRERQILDVLFRRKEATALEIQGDLADAPSYSAVRALLRILEEKGHVRHREDGPRYVYLPAVEAEVARRSALRHVLDTFFEGSAAGAMAALLGGDGAAVSKEELDRMEALIAKARKEGA